MAQKPPFREQLNGGTITRKGTTSTFILSGNRPADGKITLNVPGCKLQKADIKAIQKGQEMILTLPADAYGKDIQVICATFDQPVKPQPAAAQRSAIFTIVICFDYYKQLPQYGELSMEH